MSQRLSEIAILSYNRRAMDYLQNKDFKNCFAFLSKAEHLLSSRLHNFNNLYGTTLNNFACYYRRCQNFTTALNFLRKGLEILTKSPICIPSLAGTYLNICAILSEMGNHLEALKNAVKALKLLKENRKDSNNATLLIAAYSNIGLEYEFLHNYNEAAKVYLEALKTSERHLGNDHFLTEKLKISLKKVTGKTRFRSVQPRKTDEKIFKLRYRTDKSTNDQKKMVHVKKLPYKDLDRSSSRDQNTSTNSINKSIQVDCFDKEYALEKIRNNAAICIQKHWKRFQGQNIAMALRYQNELYQAELDANAAVKKLNLLRAKNAKKVKIIY